MKHSIRTLTMFVIMVEIIVLVDYAEAQDSKDSSTRTVSSSHEISALWGQVHENQRLSLQNQRALGGTRILMGSSAFVFSAMPYGIAQITSGAKMVKASQTIPETPNSDMTTLHETVIQNRMDSFEQWQYVGRTRLGLGGMLLTYAIAGSIGAPAAWFVYAYDPTYLPLAIGATVLDIGFYIAAISSLRRGGREIKSAQQAKRSLKVAADMGSLEKAIATNRQLQLDSKRRIGGLRIAMGASVSVFAAAGVALTIVAFSMPSSFERYLIGTISAVATLGTGFLGGYMVVTGVKMRKGANPMFTTASISPRVWLQPMFIPRSSSYPSIAGLSFGSAF